MEKLNYLREGGQIMKKIILTSIILLMTANAYAKGFDFDGYKKAKNSLPTLPAMKPFVDYGGRTWEISLNENSELVIVVAMQTHIFSKDDTYALQKFLNDNLNTTQITDVKKKARVLKWYQKIGSPSVIIDEKFFHKGE